MNRGFITAVISTEHTVIKQQFLMVFYIYIETSFFLSLQREIVRNIRNLNTSIICVYKSTNLVF